VSDNSVRDNFHEAVLLIGIISNTGKSEFKSILSDFFIWLKKKGANYLVDEALKPYFEEFDHEYCPTKELGKRCAVVLSFGGDGTLLSTARAIGESETPILGVNTGGLGYLAEISPKELIDKFQDFLAGHYDIENRMLLEAVIEDQGVTNTYYALNDVVVDKGQSSRIIRLRTSINGDFLNVYRADGLLISTPTGSTAYSLSAGGPILEPTMQGIIINPICPHSLGHRPVVIREDKVIRIEADPRMAKQVFYCDGFQEQILSPKSLITVSKSQRVVRLIRMKDKHFYHILREKLNWGLDWE